jgi:hypothetical protein
MPHGMIARAEISRISTRDGLGLASYFFIIAIPTAPT